MKKQKTKKELQSQLNNMNAELAAMKIEIANRQKEFALKQKIILELEQEIKNYD